MTDAELDELEAKARAATSWVAHAAFVAAVKPETVLRLLGNRKKLVAFVRECTEIPHENEAFHHACRACYAATLLHEIGGGRNNDDR